MIRSQDFIDAIGKPDPDFEKRISRTLDSVTASARPRPARRMIAYASAAAAVLAIFIAVASMMRSTGSRPDILAAPSAAMPTAIHHTATPVPSEQPAPSPAQLPEDWALFEAAYGQEIFALYPCAEFSRAEAITADQSGWYLNDHSGELLACRIMTGRLQEFDTDGEHEFVSINAVMPPYSSAVEDFMRSSPKWLQALYYNEEVVGNGLPLMHIIITLDESGQPFCCEMILGEEYQHYISWIRDETGEFVQLQSYYDVNHEYADTYFD